MPSINFIKRFANDVECLKKRQTIRPKRRRQVKPGDRLIFYTGQRTKCCRKLGEGYCLSVSDIIFEMENFHLSIYVDNIKLNMNQIFELARADGFKTIPDFVNFFYSKYGFPFSGNLIKW
jgi:uncharacterized protein YqfB (UPF0267 family)